MCHYVFMYDGRDKIIINMFLKYVLEYLVDERERGI